MRVGCGQNKSYCDSFVVVKECNSLFMASHGNGRFPLARHSYKPSDTLWFEIDLSDSITCLKILTNYSELPNADAFAIKQVLSSLLDTATIDINKRADRVRWMMLEMENHHTKN